MARKPNDKQNATQMTEAIHIDPVVEILAAGLVRLMTAVSSESAETAGNLPASSPDPLELPHSRALSVPVGELVTDGKAGAA